MNVSDGCWRLCVGWVFFLSFLFIIMMMVMIMMMLSVLLLLLLFVFVYELIHSNTRKALKIAGKSSEMSKINKRPSCRKSCLLCEQRKCSRGLQRGWWRCCWRTRWHGSGVGWGLGRKVYSVQMGAVAGTSLDCREVLCGDCVSGRLEIAIIIIVCYFYSYYYYYCHYHHQNSCCYYYYLICLRKQGWGAWDCLVAWYPPEIQKPTITNHFKSPGIYTNICQSNTPNPFESINRRKLCQRTIRDGGWSGVRYRWGMKISGVCCWRMIPGDDLRSVSQVSDPRLSWLLEWCNDDDGWPGLPYQITSSKSRPCFLLLFLHHSLQPWLLTESVKCTIMTLFQ